MSVADDISTWAPPAPSHTTLRKLNDEWRSISRKYKHTVHFPHVIRFNEWWCQLCNRNTRIDDIEQNVVDIEDPYGLIQRSPTYAEYNMFVYIGDTTTLTPEFVNILKSLPRPVTIDTLVQHAVQQNLYTEMCAHILFYERTYAHDRLDDKIRITTDTREQVSASD